MKNIFKKFGLVLAFLATGCSLEGDLENPNQIASANADPNLILNAVQVNFADFFGFAEQATNPLIRHQALTGGYRFKTAIQPTSLDNTWQWAYQQVLINTRSVVALATPKKFTTHVGIAKILEAYTYLTLVDMFGDVPLSQALKGQDGASGFNPANDPGADVYTKALTLLDEARIELRKTGVDAGTNVGVGAASAAIDLYYPYVSSSVGADRSKWITVANTLELKAWFNIRMIAARATEAQGKIDQLLAPGSDIIDQTSENFAFRYQSSAVPSSRHYYYDQYYGVNKGQATGYISNYFLNELYQGKGVQDPRWRYYFYRQVGSIDPNTNGFDPKALGCTPGTAPAWYQAIPGTPFCVFEPGFYGRDFGDGSGTPPDGAVITCNGVYPAGGRIDNTSTSLFTYSGGTVRGDGANGAGIAPIWMSFFTDFLKAENEARKGNNATAQTLMVTAINNSISSVRAFATGKNQTTTREPSTTSYINAVNALYAAATDKLSIIGREYHVALWGNGIEAYNLYRRTGAPNNMQPMLQQNPGPWFRSFIYSANHANINGSITQKDPNVVNKVFWDTNPNTLN